jgi:glutamate-1-semialdehyde 2,1-aminomutase
MASGENRYARSIAQLAVASAVTPSGAQTYSKSPRTLPPGIVPLYAQRAEGCRIWDVDGHEYVDLISGLAAVNLGYGDADVIEAVTKQLSDGVTISLSHPLEAVVARQIIDMVPCAEMVHFGKNGSDATTAAIRIARGFTGREHVITCGYHGWQDWFIGTIPSRASGVPQAFSNLLHPVPYNDLEAIKTQLREHPTAALIMEPMTMEWPEPGYLEGVRALTKEYGAVLIFDEMVTGFRFARGGAQEYFGVTPDLAAFGKGMANGFPLSAVVGKRELMKVLETAFISGTFGGELLSLAAANVVLHRIASTEVIAEIAATGEDLLRRVRHVVDELELGHVLSFAGHPAWVFLEWNQDLPQLEDIRNLFMQEMSRNGVLMIATHDIMAAHDEAAVVKIVDAYRSALSVVKKAIAEGSAHDLVEVDVATREAGVR